MKPLLSILLLAFMGVYAIPVLASDLENFSFTLEKIVQEQSGGEDSLEVVFENKQKSRFSFKDLKFSLQHPASFLPLKNEEVPWINPQSFTDQNGTFITYQPAGSKRSISEPYIMVQYISREMESCESIDALYAWLDNFFLGEKNRGRVLRDSFSKKTTSGLKAYCKEYFSPTNTSSLPDKRIAYAYLEYDEKYIIGMNITTYSDKDFKKLKKAFYKIVKSFDKIP